MDDTDKESKTEDATEKRINDSVVDGNVPVSREISTAASLFAFCAIYLSSANSLTLDFTYLLSSVAEQSIGPKNLSSKELTDLLSSLGLKTAIIFGPLFIVLSITALASSIVQNEPRFVTKRIAPTYSRISLAAGWKRLFSVKAFAEFLKSFVKITAASIVVSAAVSPMLLETLGLMYQSPTASLVSISSVIAQILIWVSGIAAVIAVADLAWQRYSWRADMRMSRQELKDELRQSEGDPLVKSRIRSIGRDRARSRMMNAVPTATLIVANPTHFAVALRYDLDRDAAPVVVAKGADFLALRIREIAEAGEIPVFESKDLARALYRSVKVDQIIPQQFYKAIAELIRIVLDKRKS